MALDWGSEVLLLCAQGLHLDWSIIWRVVECNYPLPYPHVYITWLQMKNPIEPKSIADSLAWTASEMCYACIAEIFIEIRRWTNLYHLNLSSNPLSKAYLYDIRSCSKVSFLDGSYDDLHASELSCTWVQHVLENVEFGRWYHAAVDMCCSTDTCWLQNVICLPKLLHRRVTVVTEIPMSLAWEWMWTYFEIHSRC